MLSALKGSVDLNLLKRRSNAPTHEVQPPLNPPESILIDLNSLHVHVCLHLQGKLRICSNLPIYGYRTEQNQNLLPLMFARNESVRMSVEQRTPALVNH